MRTMDVTQVYVIVAGGLFAVLTVLNFCLGLWRITQTYGSLVLRYLVYPFFIHRHRLIGPWSRGAMLLRVLHVTVNIFCTGFKIGSIAEAADRTGTLSLINMIPLFLGPHLSFLASTVGLSLKTFQAVHGWSALVSVLLGATHTIFSLHSSSFSLKQSICRYGLIVCVSLPRNYRRELINDLGNLFPCSAPAPLPKMFPTAVVRAFLTRSPRLCRTYSLCLVAPHHKKIRLSWRLPVCYVGALSPNHDVGNYCDYLPQLHVR